MCSLCIFNTANGFVQDAPTLVGPAASALPSALLLVGCSGWVFDLCISSCSLLVYVGILPVLVPGTLPALCVINELSIHNGMESISKL